MLHDLTCCVCVCVCAQVSGQPIFARDSNGFIVRVSCEQATGSVTDNYAQMPLEKFHTNSLSKSLALPNDYPSAPAPDGLVTEPKEHQLQVGGAHRISSKA